MYFNAIEIPFVFNYCAQNRIFFKVQQEDKRLVSMKDMSLGSHVNIVIIFFTNIMKQLDNNILIIFYTISLTIVCEGKILRTAH